MTENKHKAGFVSIIGRPNVGKSTLMNSIVGENLSIITSKAQTTRHRIMGIINQDDLQIVYSDTPGILSPKYELHNSMMSFVHQSLEDADVILFITEPNSKDEIALEFIENTQIPIIVLINKIDLSDEVKIKEEIEKWTQKLTTAKAVIPISALHKFNLNYVFEAIRNHVPEHPPFFPKDELTDKSMRFFASEILREKIMLNYREEVPYSCEVLIERFKDSDDIIRISAVILVERDSQKSIVIGKQGNMLQIIGKKARLDMEKFFGKKVFLEQYVKVEPDWRKNKYKLSKLGY